MVAAKFTRTSQKNQKVSQQLEQKLNRTPTSADIAKELNMEKEQIEIDRNGYVICECDDNRYDINDKQAWKKQRNINLIHEDEEAVAPNDDEVEESSRSSH